MHMIIAQYYEQAKCAHVWARPYGKVALISKVKLYVGRFFFSLSLSIDVGLASLAQLYNKHNNTQEFGTLEGIYSRMKKD